MKLDDYSAYVFDLDGTLVDSVPDLALALNQALTELNLNTVTEEQVRHWVGNGSTKLVERALDYLKRPSLHTKAHLLFLQVYGECVNQLSALYPQVEALLDHIHKQGKPIALLTNKPMSFVPKLLNAFGIEHYFCFLAGGDSFANKKPHPEPLLAVLSHIDVLPEHALMIGDSQSDVLCAQQAGVDVLALLQGYHQGVDLLSLNPTYGVDDISSFYCLLSNSDT